MMKVSKNKLNELADEIETKLEDIKTDNESEGEYDAGRRSNVYITLKRVQKLLEDET